MTISTSITAEQITVLESSFAKLLGGEWKVPSWLVLLQQHVGRPPMPSFNVINWETVMGEIPISGELQHAIEQIWQSIAPDVKLDDPNDNSQAIEMCLDADRLKHDSGMHRMGPSVYWEYTDLCNREGFARVEKRLCELVRLV